MRVLARCLLLFGAAITGTAEAQVAPDRTDPALITRSLPALPQQAPALPRTTLTPAPTSGVVGVTHAVLARHIEVSGTTIPAAAFARATAPFAGRALSPAEVSRLASVVAGVARARGLVFASASVQPQSVAEGGLVVTLDEGRVDAVRSLGASNAAADRILAELVTHAGVTRGELERAMLLVGDIPGLSVVNARYARENGFGILLVTVAFDRASLFVQADNRGTAEIGPWRTTELGSVRGIARAGDEISIVGSQTPANPKQFEFVSGQYSLPVGHHGQILSASAFFGSTHAGGDLAYLDLTGRSYGGSIGYSAVLQRSRRASFWFDVDLRVIRNQQNLRGARFRDDSLSVLSGTLRTEATVAGGTLRGGLATAVGLPFAGVTHEGDPRASREDGDARFVTSAVQATWRRPLGGPVTVEVAAAAQVASRPLLATSEISLGGPTIGRAYDYSERTGDQGILGSAEMQFDLRRYARTSANQLQAYVFADGGTVSNLRGGEGGGSLASAGAGLRIGLGRFYGAVEVAAPLAAERLDTGNHAARVSTRLSLLF